ncbi:MAG: hypothetical protein ACOCVB_00040 [Bacillota bacterium]
MSYRLILLIGIFCLICLILAGNDIAASQKMEGYIVAVDEGEGKIKIDNNWYDIEKETEIVRNGFSVEVKACAPVDDRLQWAEFIVKDQKIIKINVEYQVFEGEIINIDEKAKKLKLKLLQAPDYNDENLTIEVVDIEKYKKGDYLAVVMAGERLLYKFPSY